MRAGLRLKLYRPIWVLYPRRGAGRGGAVESEEGIHASCVPV
jgi:hypothetical protein